MAGESIFLSKKLFEQPRTSSSLEANTAPLINFFFGEYYKVLRKEICELTKSPAEGIMMRSESIEFLQATYDLHCTSHGTQGFTAAKLYQQLISIRDLFHLQGKDESEGRFITATSDINISGPILLNCVNTTRDMLKLIEAHPELKKKPLKTILTLEEEEGEEKQEAGKPTWKVTYKNLQAAYEQAYLKIKGLLNLDWIQRQTSEYYEQLKEFLDDAKDLTKCWSQRAKELKTKLNIHPIQSDQDFVLFTTLDYCIENIKILDNFIRNPSVDRHQPDSPQRKETLSFLEFQAIFLFKAKFLLTGLVVKQDPEEYQKKYDAILEKVLMRPKLERIKMATEKLIKQSLADGRLIVGTETEAKEEQAASTISNPSLSKRFEVLKHSTEVLMKLRKDFLDSCMAIEALIDQLAATKSKKPLPAKDDCSNEVTSTSLLPSPRLRSESTPLPRSHSLPNSKNPKGLLPALTVDLAEGDDDENEDDGEVVFTPAPAPVNDPGHKRRFSFISVLSQQNLALGKGEEKEDHLPGVPLTPS